MSTDVSTERWQQLRRGGHEAKALEIPTLDTGISTSFGTIRWALGPTGEARLLLPIHQHERIENLAVSAAVSISTATYHLFGAPIRYLDLTCDHAALETVFGEVGDEIIRRIAAGDSAAGACRSTIDDFRSLLNATPEEVSPERLAGLVGELLVLRDLILLDNRSWILWRGPLLERHDFRADALALEVKTCSRPAARTVRISSIDQLLEPEGGELVLALLELEAAAGGTISVGALAGEILAAASEPTKVRELLAAMGCPDPTAPAWNRIAYRNGGQTAYCVRNNFPRLIPSSLASVPAGVSDVSYSVDLSAAEAFVVGPEETRAYLEGMIRCLS